MAELFYKTMDVLGLNTYYMRMVVGGVLGFAFQSIVKPEISYTITEDGQYSAKPFYFLSDDPNSTILPWYLFPILGGLGLAFLL